MKVPFMIVQTVGFANEVSDEGENCVKGRLMAYALKHINQKTHMAVFYPEGKVPDNRPLCKKGEPHLEDEGRTLIVPNFAGLTKKVYVILDDYGEPAKWNEMYEPEVVEHLRKAPNCRFAVTFLLASEY